MSYLLFFIRYLGVKEEIEKNHGNDSLTVFKELNERA